ncbi:ABC transporter substrate-binding protein [Paracoccus marcusii]|uniref:ABC transporter substrate-binding protein n=1 Tax=Paracoccus marcusii TaxID=59779 RepID=UPI002ED190CD|nr:ABC transporter substrate-binding protein [Paracoccus marcusii]
MQIGNNPIAQQVGQVIQAMAAETGFDISLRATEFATLLSENVAGNFDMSLQGWSGRIDPDANIHPSSARTGPTTTSITATRRSMPCWHRPGLNPTPRPARRCTTRRAIS